MDQFKLVKSKKGGNYTSSVPIIEFIIDHGGLCFERDYVFVGTRNVNQIFRKKEPDIRDIPPHYRLRFTFFE